MQKIRKFLKKLTTKQAIVIIVSVGFIVYFNSLFNGFVWDDEEQIVNNSVIHSLGNFSQIFSGATFNTGGTATLSGWFFRPLITLWFMLGYAIFNGNAFGFHFLQLVLHLTNAVLIYLLLDNLTKSRRSIMARGLNISAAIIFAIHPGISEAVNYISAVSELAYTTTTLGALYLAISKKKINFTLIGILIFVGFLFKESALAAIPIFALFGILFAFNSKKKYLFTSLYLTLSYFTLRLLIVRTPIRHPEYSPISEASLIERLLTIPAEIFDYLRLTFYPMRLAVSQHYVVKSAQDPRFILGTITTILFLLSIVVLYRKTRSKILLFGFSILALSFGIISNIFPLDMTITERWLYFPMIGIIFIIYEFIYNLPRTKFYTSMLLVIFLIYISFFSLRTITRNTNWKTGLALYSHDIDSTGDSFDLENNLGVELYRAGEKDKASIHFRRSIELQPKWHFAYNNLGAYYQGTGNYEEAEKYYLKTLELSDYHLAHVNLSTIYLVQEMYDKTISTATESLGKLPYNSRLWSILTYAQFQNDQLEDALLSAKNAYTLSPSSQNYAMLVRIQQALVNPSPK